MDCRCHIKWSKYEEPGESGDIIFCPLHAAAGEMRDALGQLVLPSREFLDEMITIDAEVEIIHTTTALRLGLTAYDAAKGD